MAFFGFPFHWTIQCSMMSTSCLCLHYIVLSVECCVLERNGKLQWCASRVNDLMEMLSNMQGASEQGAACRDFCAATRYTAPLQLASLHCYNSLYCTVVPVKTASDSLKA
jgi:hypothetical protein